MSRSKLLSVSEVAARLGITRQRVHALITNSQLTATRLGRYYYVEETELERYVALPQGKPHAPRSTIAPNSIDKSQ